MRWHYRYAVQSVVLNEKQSQHFEAFFQTVRDYGFEGWEMVGFTAVPISSAAGTVSLWLSAWFKMPELVGVKTCPRCAEEVRSAALACRYCSHEFPAPETP